MKLLPVQNGQFYTDMFYVNLMVTKKQKSRVDLQNVPNGETGHTTMEKQPFKKAGSNSEKNRQWKEKTTRN